MKVTRGDNSILIEFTNEEFTILADGLPDPLAHFETVAREKLANCQSRLLDEWSGKLRRERRVEAIPTEESALLDLILAQPDYKDRAARDEEARNVATGERPR